MSTKLEHPDERRVRLLVEMFQADLKRLIDFATVEGRPIFHKALSKQEQLQRWQDPTMQAQILQDIALKGGLDAAKKWVTQMRKLEGENE